MGTITVNLQQYPKFWRDFAARGSAFDPSAVVTAEQFEHWMQEWYGLSVRCREGEIEGTVSMNHQDFTAFALVWS